MLISDNKRIRNNSNSLEEMMENSDRSGHNISDKLDNSNELMGNQKYQT